MIDQKFVNWTPVRNIPRTLFVEKVIDNYEGLKISLKGKDEEDQTLELFFSDRIFYRNINESYFLRTIDSASDIISSPLVIVENSNLIKWLHEESYHIYKNEEIVHYLILCGNDCVEVLSNTSPLVSWCPSRQE